MWPKKQSSDYEALLAIREAIDFYCDGVYDSSKTLKVIAKSLEDCGMDVSEPE